MFACVTRTPFRGSDQMHRESEDEAVAGNLPEQRSPPPTRLILLVHSTILQIAIDLQALISNR